jgi:hypothetical protein
VGQLFELHKKLVELRLEARAIAAGQAGEPAAPTRGSLESCALADATENLWRALDALHGKANFNRNQPRVPRGNRDGGQWTDDPEYGGGASSAGRSRQIHEQPGDELIWPELPIRSRDGHHYGPQSFLRELGLPPETMKVFADAKTGPVFGTVNQWNRLHRLYNEAVEADFWEFVAEEGIDPKKMTPDQARRFIRRIVTSTKPPIREFNLRVWINHMSQLFRRRVR